jgi:hypothetical protein
MIITSREECFRQRRRPCTVGRGDVDGEALEHADVPQRVVAHATHVPRLGDGVVSAAAHVGDELRVGRRDHARLAAAAHEHAVALGWRARARTRRRADTLPASCRGSRAAKVVAHSEKACFCSMLDVEAKGGGEGRDMRGTKSPQQCWSWRFVAAVLVLLTRERATIEDVVAQL